MAVGFLTGHQTKIHIFIFSSILALIEVSSKTRQVIEGLCLPALGIGRLLQVTMASLLNLLQAHLAVELEVHDAAPDVAPVVVSAHRSGQLCSACWTRVHRLGTETLHLGTRISSAPKTVSDVVDHQSSSQSPKKSF